MVRASADATIKYLSTVARSEPSSALQKQAGFKPHRSNLAPTCIGVFHSILDSQKGCRYSAMVSRSTHACRTRSIHICRQTNTGGSSGNNPESIHELWEYEPDIPECSLFLSMSAPETCWSGFSRVRPQKLKRPCPWALRHEHCEDDNVALVSMVQ
jgi:hypothetical protein